MSLPIIIKDGHGSLMSAKVSDRGELITRPFAYNDSKFQAMNEVNTAYNFYGPKVGFNFILDIILLKANKLVSAVTDATVIIYEAENATTTTVDKVLIQLAMVETDLVEIQPRIAVTEGKYVNGKTDDDDVTVNMMGYYAPIPQE